MTNLACAESPEKDPDMSRVFERVHDVAHVASTLVRNGCPFLGTASHDPCPQLGQSLWLVSQLK